MATNLPVTIGRYRITGELGRGGMGIVLAALDPALDRPVAVKLIRLDPDNSITHASDLEQRFLREARVAARLDHPAIATVYDAGREGDSLYLVMELVQGESLARRLAEGRVPGVPEALEIAAQVADALDAAHTAGVVHRDIKPANILLTRAGQVKVSDFGVAKAVGESTELTRSGTVIGSPAYMAPEQIQGSPVDGRTDLFSLGVVLYELLLRRRPFPADTVTTLIYQVLHQDPFEDGTTFRALGPELAGFLRLALAKQPAARVSDARTFARAARELAARPVTANSVLGTARTVILRPAESAEALTRPTALGTSVLGTEARVGPTSPTTGAPALAPVAAFAPDSAGMRRRWLPTVIAATLFAAAVLLVLLVMMERRPGAPPSLAGSPASFPVAPAVSSVAGGANSANSAGPLAETGPVAAPEPAPGAVIGVVTRQPLTVSEPTPRAASPAAAAASRPAADPAARRAPIERSEPTPVPAAAVAIPEPELAVPLAEPAPAEPAVPPLATFESQNGAEFNVSPEEAIVAIDGRVIGPADDWDGAGGGKVYRFPGPGTYDVRLALPGYRTVHVRVIVRPGAEEEIADVDTELEEVD